MSSPVEKYVKDLKNINEVNKQKILIAEAVAHAFPKPKLIEVTLSSYTNYKIKLTFPIGEEIKTQHFKDFDEYLVEKGYGSEDPTVDVSFMTNSYRNEEEKTVIELLLYLWV